MSIEQFPQPDHDPLSLGPQVPLDVLQLQRGDKATLDQVMVPQERANQQWGITGDVLGVIELPPNPESVDDMLPAGGEGFRIAVVDYGDDYASKLLADGKPGFGSPRSRYTLQPLNYTHPMQGGYGVVNAAVPFDTLTVGRDKMNGAGRDLLLDSSQEYPSLGAVSREHFTLRVGNGGVEIEDHSSNGTKVYRAPESVFEAVEQGVEEATGHAVEQVGEVALETTTTAIDSIGTVGLQESVVVEPVVEPVIDTATSQERERREIIEAIHDHFFAVSRIAHDPGSQEENDMYINRRGGNLIDGLERRGKPTTAGLLVEAITSGHIITPDRIIPAATRLMGHFDELLLKHKDPEAEDRKELIHVYEELEQFARSGAYAGRESRLSQAGSMMHHDISRVFDDKISSEDVRTAYATRALYAASVLNADPNASGFIHQNLAEILERSL